jgi:hypothetical protein
VRRIYASGKGWWFLNLGPLTIASDYVMLRLAGRTFGAANRPNFIEFWLGDIIGKRLTKPWRREQKARLHRFIRLIESEPKPDDIELVDHLDSLAARTGFQWRDIDPRLGPGPNVQS